MSRQTLYRVVLIGCFVISLASCRKHSAAVPRFAYVTNGAASFWVIAEAGVGKAAAELGVRATVHMPTEGISSQKAIIEDLLSRGVDGIAIAPIDPANQASLLNEAANKTILITQDSDAPGTQRRVFIGIDNYLAGRLCGQLVKEALPDGGKLMVFIGRLEQDNAKRRRQGLIDELMGREFNPARYDPPGEPIQNERYQILGTLTDQFDRAKGKANCEDAFSRYPDLQAIVGLFAYNVPLCLEAMKQSGTLGRIKVVSFDEDDATLQGIKDGFVYGTVVQDPYRYGYESIRVLAALHRGENSVVPASGIIEVPARQIRADHVDAFWGELNSRLGKH